MNKLDLKLKLVALGFYARAYPVTNADACIKGRTTVIIKKDACEDIIIYSEAGKLPQSPFPTWVTIPLKNIEAVFIDVPTTSLVFKTKTKDMYFKF